MLAIISRTIKDRKVVILAYIIAASAFLLMYISMFPSFADQKDQWDAMMKTMPESMMKAFNLGDYSFAALENFLSAEEFMFVWPLLLIILAISSAGGAIAAEIEKGTIELLLSQSISRIKLFIARYLSGFIAILLFVAVTVFLAIPLAGIFNIEIQASHYLTLALVGFLFGTAIFSISIFLSAIFSDKGKVYFISAGILVLMYVANIVASLKDNYADLKYFSFFYYYNPADALIRNKIDEAGIWVFIATIVVFTIAGLIAFEKRDIST